MKSLNEKINLNHNYDYEISQRQYFKGESLAYITPWNSKGYDYAKIYREKFTYISPVWYQIKRNNKNELILNGGQDVDQNWLNEVKYGKDNIYKNKENDIRPKIVPRVIIETSLEINDFYILGKLLRLECDQQNFDGFVIELPLNKHVIQLSATLSNILRNPMGEFNSKIIILVLPPNLNRNNDIIISPTIFQKFLPYIDLFSIMTYDYPNLGPNSPINWVKDSLKTFIVDKDVTDYEFLNNKANQLILSKLLLGIPFYGYLDKRQPLLSHDYLNLINNEDANIKWNEEYQEHIYEFNDKNNNKQLHSFTYPSQLFLKKRLELANKFNCGIAIWEIGQGSEYLFDEI